jgi:ADP-ribose pyrophosphatase
VERRLFELPAGILDVAGESGQQTAARELAEEAGVVARDWSPLLDMWSSPGMTDEHWQVFCARSLEAVPQSEAADLAARVHEEADLEVVWVPLQAAVRAVLERRVCDSMAVAGVLAVAAAAT